jgi:conjugal transfer pilin signal peptidase TrbI
MKYGYKRWFWIGTFLMVLILISQVLIVRWNISNSLPGRMFVGIPLSFIPQKGDMISFDHPKFKAPIAKIVVGVAGDEVYIKDNHIFVNGTDRGIVLDKSPHSGRPLIPTQAGTIPEGYVYVWAPHPESYDSRYAEVGLIHVSHIKERLWCVF